MGDEVEVYKVFAEGTVQHFSASNVLAPKKPGFEIRDLAFILDKSGDAIQGEIVAIGSGPKKRAFYQ